MLKLSILALLVAASVAEEAPVYEDICGTRTGTFFVKDPKNCQNYYGCKDGSEVWQDQCPKNYLFNEQAGRCEPAEDVQCTAPLPPPGEEACGAEIENLPIPGNCTHFKFCSEGETSIRHCAAGTLFDENYRICRDEKVARCNECPLQNPEKPFFIPDRTDCRKYFVCHNRVKKMIFCDKKLYWDQEVLACRQACTTGIGAYKCPYEDSDLHREYCK